MALFKKKQKGNIIDERGRAKVLDQEKLIGGVEVPKKQLEEIVKTTDSMQVLSKSFKENEETDAQKLSDASKAILRSYDLAVRKINATYQEVIETKKYVSNEFLTVQILIRDYEKFNDMDQIQKVIGIFADEVQAQLSYGRSVWFSDELVIEATDYINKMIPVARVITPEVVILNTLKWADVANALVKANRITTIERGIIEILIEAIVTNVANGYYVKIGNLLVARIRPDEAEAMVLFNTQTIHKMNKIYSTDRLKNRAKVVSRSNYINNFKNSIDRQKEIDAQELRKLESIEAEAKAFATLQINEIQERDEQARKDAISRKAKIEAKVLGSESTRDGEEIFSIDNENIDVVSEEKVKREIVDDSVQKEMVVEARVEDESTNDKKVSSKPDTSEEISSNELDLSSLSNKEKKKKEKELAKEAKTKAKKQKKAPKKTKKSKSDLLSDDSSDAEEALGVKKSSKKIK